MEPYRVKRNGRELMNAAAVGEMLGITGETYQWYVRTGRPEDNPAPGHVEIDNVRGERLYSAKEVRAWNKSRPGRGNWGGEGARARDKFREQDAARYDEILRDEGVEPGAPDDDASAAVIEDAHSEVR